ncbi:zinc-binding dehydrogenase [Streptomyces sp. NPDC007205]|uniref:zinc-binding dehydrogenase n=1 Tax=Streptomyces sp. NPDC007205 TaxID=3154316 RepID=UPI0033DAD439
MADEDPADHVIFGWGGGVALAALLLARRCGFRTATAASSSARFDLIAKQGITPVDRREFPDIDSRGDKRQRACARAFLRQISALSDGQGCAIILDNLGGPTYETTLRALARQGVISTCGWKTGMNLNVTRAAECRLRHLHVYTHAWRFPDTPAIRGFAEKTGWLAAEEFMHVYDFDDIPRLAAEFEANRIDSYSRRTG